MYNTKQYSTCDNGEPRIFPYDEDETNPFLSGGEYPQSPIFLKRTGLRSFAKDHYTSLENKLLYLREVCGSWGEVFSDDYIELLITSLDHTVVNVNATKIARSTEIIKAAGITETIEVMEITEKVREILLPYFGTILNGWIKFGNNQSARTINYLIGDDREQKKYTLNLLERYIHDRTRSVQDIHKLSHLCMFVDREYTLTFLNLDEFCDKYITSTKDSRGRYLTPMNIFNTLGAKLWNKKDNPRIIRGVNVYIKSNEFAIGVEKLRLTVE